MNRILFVDDEQKVLDGLQRMLSPMRHEWRMAFVSSPREALRLLSETEYDVLVTDLRMPEMSGLELLSQVLTTNPHTVRLVLSGTADQQTTLRSTTLAHQYLVKPCDAATLRATVRRAFSLRVMLGDPALQDLISSIHALPSVPAVYSRLVELLEAPEASPQQVGELIGQDMSMTAKVLQLINSAFFGIRREVTNPVEGVVYLGISTVRELVLMASVFSAFRLRARRHFSIETLQDHSLAVGNLAKRIARAMRLPEASIDQAYVGGLLHVVGKLVLASHYAEKYEHVLQAVITEEIPERMAELKIFGTTHAEAGAYLLWLWALPDPVTEIVLRHHEFPADLEAARTPVAAVFFADALVNGGLEEDQTVEYLRALGVGGYVESWKCVFGAMAVPEGHLC